MEYTLKITVSPTIDEGTQAARVFITARDEDGTTKTEQVWSTPLMAVVPGETADPAMWALMLVKDIAMALEPDVYKAHFGGTANTMLSLFEPKRHFIM